MRDIFDRLIRPFLHAFGVALGLMPGAGIGVFVCRDGHLRIALLAGAGVWSAMALTLSPWLRTPQGVAAWLSLLLWQPVLEEVLFRGLIQGFLRQMYPKGSIFMGVSLPNLIASLLFVAAHLMHQPVLWALSVLPPSLVFGYFRDRYGSIWGSLFLHVFYNAGLALTAVILHDI
jgi:membrane protease YdiL (CAAX protease family)